MKERFNTQTKGSLGGPYCRRSFHLASMDDFDSHLNGFYGKGCASAFEL